MGGGFILKPEDFIEDLGVVAFNVFVGDFDHRWVNAELLILLDDLLKGLFCHEKISKIIQILYRENLFLPLYTKKLHSKWMYFIRLHLRKLY